MAKKANTASVPAFKTVSENAELLVEDLRERVQLALNADTHHRGVIADRQNEVSAWAKLAQEQSELEFLVQTMTKHGQKLVIDADALRKQVALGLTVAQKTLSTAEAERDVDPLYQIAREIGEHEKAEKAARAQKQAEAEAAAVAEMDAANRELRKAAYADGRFATWQQECEELKGQAKIAAKKARTDGKQGSVKEVRAILRTKIANYFATVGLQDSKYVGDRRVSSKTFAGYVDEMVKLVDPDRPFVKESKPMPAGNVASFTTKGATKTEKKHKFSGKVNPKGQKYQDDKPEMVATAEDIAAFMGGSAEGDGTMGAALNAAGVKAS